MYVWIGNAAGAASSITRAAKKYGTYRGKKKCHKKNITGAGGSIYTRVKEFQIEEEVGYENV